MWPSLALALVSSVLATASAVQNVLWLPLGDSITFGCTGPTIQDCHAFGGGYRVPLAFALTQPALGDPANAGFNVTTMGTATTGPDYVPAQWLRHCGFPGWTIPMIDAFLPKAFASSAARPDIITIHLGTNDCNGGHTLTQMTTDMNSLLGHIFATSPASHVFLGDTIPAGQPWNTCITTWSAAVPGIVAAWAAKGMVITFVPLNYEAHGMCGSTGDDYNLCGGHQIHPTSAGYPRMASAFALQIMLHFNRTS